MGSSQRLTPLHLAAENGHFEICRMIMDSVEDKNPADQWGTTPWHEAERNGHYDICKLIEGALN